MYTRTSFMAINTVRTFLGVTGVSIISFSHSDVATSLFLCDFGYRLLKHCDYCLLYTSAEGTVASINLQRSLFPQHVILSTQFQRLIRPGNQMCIRDSSSTVSIIKRRDHLFNTIHVTFHTKIPKSLSYSKICGTEKVYTLEQHIYSFVYKQCVRERYLKQSYTFCFQTIEIQVAMHV